jgi:AcrR family transcriptional regulator
MTIQERKERERDERRELILNAASEIIMLEGIGSLSIRKIANKIDYSPAIIYHYFIDKDDIINQLMQRGYKKIVGTLTSVDSFPDDPRRSLRETMRRYIDMALQMPTEYMTILLNPSPVILEHTSTLFVGAATTKPALNILFRILKDIYKDKNLDDSFIELTTQIIWTSIFGLIIRLIVEKELLTDDQRGKLIDHHLKVTIDGIVFGNPLYNY